nr:hypothetical protein [Phytoactinopolyspora limicola]
MTAVQATTILRTNPVVNGALTGPVVADGHHCAVLTKGDRMTPRSGQATAYPPIPVDG